MAIVKAQTALDRFITSTRELFLKESDLERRWQSLAPILCELLADREVQAASKRWPECIGTDRAENLIFYEDPDHGFAINALKRLPKTTQAPRVRAVHPEWKGIHDHAHIYTLYGVLVGHETLERYQRVDDRSQDNYAEIQLVGNFPVKPGYVDLVRPYEIHAERSLGEETVAIIIRSEKSGSFLQGRYTVGTGEYWRGYGPRQTPVDMFS
jgi:hypothetical protein